MKTVLDKPAVTWQWCFLPDKQGGWICYHQWHPKASTWTIKWMMSVSRPSHLPVSPCHPRVGLSPPNPPGDQKSYHRTAWQITWTIGMWEWSMSLTQAPPGATQIILSNKVVFPSPPPYFLLNWPLPPLPPITSYKAAPLITHVEEHLSSDMGCIGVELQRRAVSSKPCAHTTLNPSSMHYRSGSQGREEEHAPSPKKASEYGDQVWVAGKAHWIDLMFIDKNSKNKVQ